MIGVRHSIAARALFGLLLAAAVSVGGCSSDPTGPAEPLTAEVTRALDRALQDEYHAENVYLRVLADLGDVAPFRNVVHAEERHSQSLATLLARRDLPVPLSDWDLNNVPRFATLSEACAAAVEAEVANIEMYDDFFALSLPGDVRTVFENNRAASLDRHLPAFRGCS